MDVLTHTDVVDEVPACVIGIVIYNELVAGPAPWRGDRPVPVSNLELTAGQPDSASAEVDAIGRIEVRRSGEREPAVLERAREAEARIIERCMSVPLIVTHVRRSGRREVWLKHWCRVSTVAGRRPAWDSRLERPALSRCPKSPAPASAPATGLCRDLRRNGYRNESGGGNG